MDTSGKEEESLSDREEEPDETKAADRLSLGKVSHLKKKQQCHEENICVYHERFL